MKKVLALLVAVCMLVAVIPVTSHAAEQEHTHEAKDGWQSDSGQHWLACSGCDEKLQSSEHLFDDWVIIKEATTAEAGSKERVCLECGYKEIVELPIHILDETAGWQSDNIYHWNQCSTCDDKLNIGEHNYEEWIVTKEATMYDFGTEESSCTVCGNKTTGIIPMLPGHTHVAKEEFDVDADRHWIACADPECGKQLTVQGHMFGEWSVTKEATTTEVGSKERECSICKYKDIEEIPMIEEPTTEEPTTEEPTTEEPTTEEPTTEEPTTEEPTTEEPTTEEPTTEEPTTEEPTTEEPTTEEPTTEEPTTEEEIEIIYEIKNVEIKTAGSSDAEGLKVEVEDLADISEKAEELCKEIEAEKAPGKAVVILEVEVVSDNGTEHDMTVTLTFEVEGIKASDQVTVVHWLTDDSGNVTGEVEYIVPDAVRDGEIDVTFTSLSPIAIVVNNDIEVVPNTPPTGDAASVMLWSLAAMVAFVAVAIVAAMKKYRIMHE